MATCYNIVNGPSKYDFMLALFDSDSRHRRQIMFELDRAGIAEVITLLAHLARCPHHTPPVFINGVSRESGDGENWNFSGWSEESLVGSWNVRGYYSTKTRKGWIEFLER